MIKKGNLFHLIKSLSKSEKRYFRIYATTGSSEANYLRLFDFIGTQKEPNDSAIKLHFKNEQFINQLHVAKIYLTDLILKSLRNYSVNNSVYNNILDLLRDAEVLFEKELFDLCRLRLKKAEQLAIQYEKEALLLEVLAWKRRMLMVQSQNNQAKQERILNSEQETLLKLSEINYCWQQTNNIFELYRDKKLLKNFVYKKPSTQRSATLIQHLKYTYYFMNGRPALAEKAVSDLIEILEQSPRRISDDPSPYVTAISNKISMLIGQKRWTEIESLILQMREVPERFKLKSENKFTVRLWLRIFNLELEVYRDTQKLDQAISLIREIESFLETKNSSVPDNYRLMLYFQIASVYFSKKDFSKALIWTNHILNFNFGEIKEDLQCYARLLNLLVHFELNNIIVLRYAIDSTRRFFKKKKFSNDFAQQSLKLLSRLSLVSPIEYQAVFSKYYHAFFNDSVMINAHLDYVDIKEWIENKTEYSIQSQS